MKGRAARFELRAGPRDSAVRHYRPSALAARVGDRVVNTNGEWEVVGGPWSVAAGTRVYVFVQRSGAPGTKREPAWAAHEKITVSDRRR